MDRYGFPSNVVWTVATGFVYFDGRILDLGFVSGVLFEAGVVFSIRLSSSWTVARDPGNPAFFNS